MGGSEKGLGEFVHVGLVGPYDSQEVVDLAPDLFLLGLELVAALEGDRSRMACVVLAHNKIMSHRVMDNDNGWDSVL